MPTEVSTVSGDQSVEELRRELAEAREQQAATAEILRVISSSPTDLQHMFAVVAANAARLCDANDAQIRQVDGSTLRLVAQHGSIASNPVMTATRGLVSGRAVLEHRTVQIADMHAVADEYPEGSDIARRFGYRTFLAVPLICAGNAIGVINVRRAECRPFTDRQIDLLKTFADQAVIAIENARLFETEQASKRELQEALEYQTATSTVLGVISRSPNDVQPVLEAIARTTRNLCAAERAMVWRLDGDGLRPVAFSGISTDRVEEMRAILVPVDQGSMPGRALTAQRALHVHDVLADEGLVVARDYLRSGNIRTVIAVLLLRQGASIGAITASRTTVSPFDSRQIALVETFANQAVISIENARLFEAEQTSKRELQESLEQQIATSEVLQIISSSPGDLQPVFDAILANAVRFCEAKFGNLFLCEGDTFRAVAVHGPPTDYVEWYRREPVLHKADITNVPLGRLGYSKKVIHILDLREDQGYLEQHPRLVALVESAGARTILGVPMLKGYTLPLLRGRIMGRAVPRPANDSCRRHAGRSG